MTMSSKLKKKAKTTKVLTLLENICNLGRVLQNYHCFLGKALLMLNKWTEIEGDGATKDEIIYILEGLKMKEAFEGVFA